MSGESRPATEYHQQAEEQIHSQGGLAKGNQDLNREGGREGRNIGVCVSTFNVNVSYHLKSMLELKELEGYPQ